MKKVSLLFLAVGAILMGCSDKDNNLSKPEIHVENVTPAVTSDSVCDHLVDNVIIAHQSETLAFTFHLVGENELSQLKIDIHENSDCHDHDHAHKTVPFETIIIKELSGTEVHLTESIVIPADAKESNYHVDIKLLDKLGNEGETVEYHLVIHGSH